MELFKAFFLINFELIAFLCSESLLVFIKLEACIAESIDNDSFSKMYRARDNIDSDYVFNTDENNNVFKTKIKVRPSFTNIEDIESIEEIDSEKLKVLSNSDKRTATDVTCTSNDSEPKQALSSNLINQTTKKGQMNSIENQLNRNITMSNNDEVNNGSSSLSSAIHASVLLSTSNDSEHKKAISSKLIEETALNSSMSGTKNELDGNQILSKKIESENESLSIDSAKHASSLINTSNDSEHKKAISSKLIEETALNSSMSGTKNELNNDLILNNSEASIKKANILKSSSDQYNETRLEKKCKNHEFCFSNGNIRNGSKNSSTYSCPYEKDKKEKSQIEISTRNESLNLRTKIETNDSKLREKKTTGLNKNLILINNESLVFQSGNQESALKYTINETEPKEALSSNLINQTTKKGQMNSIENQLNRNITMSNNDEVNNGSSSLSSAIHASVLLSTSNDSEHKKAISSKLIEETSKILSEKNKNIKSEKQYSEISNLDDIFNKKNNKR
jgi:hypothetical protein